jgi:predicted MFS family arabinose efflux permease
MLLLPPLAQILIDAYGWRTAHRMIGAGTLSFLVLLIVLPLGRVSAGAPAWRARRAAQADAPQSAWTISAALGTGAFWCLFLAYFATAVAAYSVLPHSVAYLVERGIDPLVSASAFGFTGVMSALGIVAIGNAADRFGWLGAVTLSFALTIAGVAALMGVTAWPSLWLVYGFVVGFGLMQGARGPILVSLVGKIFGGGAVGTIFGALSMALGLGAAFGSYASGLLYKATGSYLAAFSLSIAACCVALATFWLAPSLRQERVVARFDGGRAT